MKRCREYLNINYETLEDVILELSKFPKEATLEIDFGDSYMEAYACWEREETEEELRQKAEEDKRCAEYLEKQDLATLARLKAKYEKDL